VIVITAYASIDTAVEAIKRGAADYLPKPFTPAQVALVTSKVAEQRAMERKFEALKAASGGDDPEADFPTADPAMQRALDLAHRVAGSNATVLIQGELGTGKERLARAIHSWSARANGPFVPASCQSSSPAHLEEELFGISSAEAPNASPGQRGKIAFSEGGTLILKDIADMPLVLQPRVTRLLHDKEYERRNDFTPRRADVRVVVTSSIDLRAAAARGAIRADLLLAVDVVAVDIPPLRERRADIPLLAERYLAHLGRQHGRRTIAFSTDAMDALRKHAYPGNSRELRNLIERAVLICTGDQIELRHLPANLLNSPGVYSIGDLVALETITDLHIRRVLASTRSFESAASILGINSITLWRRRKKYGI
jgi:NtrC-family two-component system response regulator AlgB